MHLWNISFECVHLSWNLHKFENKLSKTLARKCFVVPHFKSIYHHPKKDIAAFEFMILRQASLILIFLSTTETSYRFGCFQK